MWAAAKGKAQVIQVMCRHGADPNFKVYKDISKISVILELFAHHQEITSFYL
jgi:hypothetical protein